MRKFIVILIMFLCSIAAYADNSAYMQYMEKVLNADLPIVQRVDACNDIRNLPDSVYLTKAQLYALKIAARYKISNIWARTILHFDDKNSEDYAAAEISKEGSFYLNKLRSSKTDIDIHTNNFFLSLFEYASLNTSMGKKAAEEELSYFRSKSYLKAKAKFLSDVFDLTKAFCEEKPVNEIINIIKSIDYRE